MPLIVGMFGDLDWPLWAYLPAVLFAQPGDRGLGDTLGRELASSDGAKFKAWHEAMFGIWAKPCNCANKLTEFNRLYPYL